MWKTMIVACLLLLPETGRADTDPDALFSVDGYRIAHYRGPVMQPPDGVGRVALEVVPTLRPSLDVLLIDVLPAEGGHRNADGSWHLAANRPSIPGAHWFPEAGRGVLAPGIGPWFARGIARLTGGVRNRMIVTFCLADCWMSWNAARRLRALGYTNVWWFAEGTDGWRDLGLPLIEVTPER